MKSTAFHKEFASFPWSTFGRPEIVEDVIEKVEDQRRAVRLFSKQPKISIFVPLNSSSKLDRFRKTVSALSYQSYANFEVFVYSSRRHRSFRDVVKADRRFHWIENKDQSNTSVLRAKALQACEGEWLLFLEPNALLAPSTLFEYMREIQREDADVLYCNEVEIDKNTKKTVHFFSKPTFSWFNLIHFNYIGLSFIVKKSALKEAGGLNAALFPFSEYDLLLRLSEVKASFRHVPAYLYYRGRRNRNPISQKKQLVSRHLRRCKFSADVESKQLRTINVRPTLKEPKKHLVSVIICFKDKAKWTARCLKNLSHQIGEIPTEVILVNNGSKNDEFLLIKKEIEHYNFPIKLVDYPHRFNFAAMHNWAVKEHAKGDYLFLLNNDVFFDGKFAIDDIFRWAQFDWVGTVGCRLHYPDGSIQYGGMEAGYGGFNRLVRVRHVTNKDNYVYENKEVLAATFAACAFKRKTFEEIGGLNPFDFYNHYGDVAFTFECLRLGMHNLYLGHLHAEHLESVTEGVRYYYWNECKLEDRYPEMLQRMLRHDLGVDRVPRLDTSIKGLLRSGLGATIAENFPWLNPVKRKLKKSLLLNRFVSST